MPHEHPEQQALRLKLYQAFLAARDAVSSPYVIKSRFSYAAAHLCHQANRARNLARWEDKLPTERAIYLNHAAPFGKGWRSFQRFMCCAEAIGGRVFQVATGDFRNAYNHRFPRRFVIGQTGLVTRRVDEATGQASYAIGGAPALQLNEVATLLATERDLAQATFEAFQALVREHEAAITAFEQARPISA